MQLILHTFTYLFQKAEQDYFDHKDVELFFELL